MSELQYTKVGGLKQSDEQIATPQTYFVKLHNYLPSKTKGGIAPRGGSSTWSHTGNIWGINGYKKRGSTLKVPFTDVPVRYRRNGSTNYIEKLNWLTDVWDTVTQGASTSFDIGANSSFAQIADSFAVAAGRPAVITDITAGNINRLGGPAPTAAPGNSTAAGALTGSFVYVYTFYDSTTGWESSPSPATGIIVVTAKNITLTGLETVCAREGVDKKRIYRTISTGESPYLRVTEVTLATTTYADSTLDASLGADAPDANDHDPPPTDCYLIEAHEGRFWCASGRELYYSLAYDGNGKTLEYFSPFRLLTFSQTITGLRSLESGGLLVFTAPGFGIWEVQGRNESSFDPVLKYPYEGTNYHTSVATDGSRVVYWGESGPKIISGNGLIKDLSEDFIATYQSALSTTFDEDMFVWSVWAGVNRGFIVSIGGTNTSAGDWSDDAGFAPVQWEDATTMTPVEWES